MTARRITLKQREGYKKAAATRKLNREMRTAAAQARAEVAKLADKKTLEKCVVFDHPNAQVYRSASKPVKEYSSTKTLLYALAYAIGVIGLVYLAVTYWPH